MIKTISLSEVVFCYDTSMLKHSEQYPSEKLNRCERTYIGALGRLTGNAIRNQANTGRTLRRLRLLDKMLAPKTLTLPLLPPRKHEQVAKVMEQTDYWHGTGRYQYRNGKVVDILDYIARHKELQPGSDPFEVSGHMKSLSLARSRIYARTYADLHRDAALPLDRYGTSAFWSVVFLADYVLEAARDEGGLRQVIKRLERNGKDEWHAKVNRQPLSVFATFATGSDIAGNYPIIFGVHDVETLPTSRAIAIHEVRSGDAVKLDRQVTHLEAPRINIKETEEILAKHAVDIPVYVIEDFERYAATLPASRLMS